MSYYEHVFIARQDLSAQQMEALIDTFTKVVEEKSGKIAKKEYWGLKTLAYKIKKNRKGHYALLDMEANGAAIAELERQERLHEDVLRFMTVRVDELQEGPSIVMQPRSSDKRDRGGDRNRSRS